MSYYVKKKQSDFIPAPEGLHYAVCVDVVDLGGVELSWQGQKSVKDMVRLVWQTEDTISSGAKAGQPYMINRRYTSSNHKKATLRIHCESWRGKSFTDEEFASFDLEKLIGVCCQIQLTHNTTDGNVYANIQAIVPAPRGRQPLKAVNYTRVKNRDGYEPPKSALEIEGAEQEEHGEIQEGGNSDDDCPF